jgi:hypothetical protein
MTWLQCSHDGQYVKDLIDVLGQQGITTSRFFSESSGVRNWRKLVKSM